LKIVLDHRSPISQIPNEILLRLFTYYLNPSDLFNSCIRVNQRWKNIIQDKTIWKIVNPINWAKSKHFISFIKQINLFFRSMEFKYSFRRNNDG
jgi:hypothetical protein